MQTRTHYQGSITRKGLTSKYARYCVFLSALLLTACAQAHHNNTTYNKATQVPYVINNITYYPIPDAYGYEEKGIASWYGKKFHGRKTSNGERYDMYAMTAAHKTLPMNTMLLVENLENGKEIVVRVNDRGPFIRGRVVDLSYTAAKKLGMANKGISKVKITALTQKPVSLPKTSPQPTVPDLYQGEYYIQVGAFSNQSNAIKLKQRFTDAGEKVVIHQSESRDIIYYRVQVYAGSDLREAKRAESSLLGLGYTGAFVVAR